MDITYSVVVPVFNEEEVLRETHKRLKETMDSCGAGYELIYVNDGSSDRTLDILKDICESDAAARVLNFSRNFGHQTAITAGMDHASGDAIIVIDADLQDPPHVILTMIEKWKEGFKVVYGTRLKRRGESAFKKFTAKAYYRFLNKLTDVDIPVDTGDFRLIDRKVCEALRALPERNRYVRGLVAWVGFSQTNVEFVREERFAGTTKYPLRKMLRFATDGITSFSNKPLKISIWLGSLISFVSFLFLVFVVLQRLLTDAWEPGWSSLAAISLFFNGIVLIMLGIIGGYIGRIYDETKGRPLYIISDLINFDKDKTRGLNLENDRTGEGLEP